MYTTHSSAHSSRPSASRPSDTFRPRGRLPLDPFTSPAHASSYSSYNGSTYNNAHASSSSASSPTRMNPNAQRRDSGSSMGSAYEYVEQGAMWRVPRALVYGYEGSEWYARRRGVKGQVVLVLGDPPASELLPLLSSPHLADPTTSLVLIATSNPPGYLLRQPATQGGSNTGPGPAIRILRLAVPLDAHQGGALRLVSLFERAGRVVDAWRFSSSSGSGLGSGPRKGAKQGPYTSENERIVQLAEDAVGEFVCVEAYRPALDPSGSMSKGGLRTRRPSPPEEHGSVSGAGNGAEQDREKKKKFRFSMGMGSGSPGGGSDSPRPLIESRMQSSPPTSPLSSSSFSAKSTAGRPKSKSPEPASPYASRRLSQSSFSLSSAAALGTTTSQPTGGRTFDAIVNFLPAQAPDKALLKHAILVSTLGAQYLGVGDQSSSSSGMAGQSQVASTNTTTTPTRDEHDAGVAKLRKRPSRRLSMTQRLSGFFGMGGGAGVDEKALKELREMADGKEKEKQKQKQTAVLSGASAVPLHAHVVHILPPNMGNAQERPHGYKLVQGIEQFLLTFAYPLGSMLGGAGSGAGGRSSTYGYVGSSGSLSSLSSLGSAGVQMNNMGVNIGGGAGTGTHSAFSSATSSRNSSSSSLSAMGMSGNVHPHVYANSSQHQPTGQAQAQQPRSRSLFSIGSPGESRRASYLDGSSSKESDSGVTQKNHKPTTPPSAYPVPHMQRQRVRSSGSTSSHRPSSMYSTSTYGHANNGPPSGMLGGEGSLAQLAAQMAGRPVPYLVAPGVLGAPIGAVGSSRAGARASESEGVRRMTYGEAILLGVLDWDSGVEGGVGAGVRGAGRAYVAWGDVVCDGEVEGEDADENNVELTEPPPASVPAATLKKHAIESTPRPAPTTTQLPTPPESSASSAESSVEGGDVESEVVSVADERHDSDKTPRFGSTSRFMRSPSSSARSSGSSVESNAQASSAAHAVSLTSLTRDPSVKLSRTAEPAAGSACGTEANGTSAAGNDRGAGTDEAAIIGEPSPLDSTSLPSAVTSLPSPSLQERRRNHRPAPLPPSTPSPLVSFMVAETQGNKKQTETPALPKMVRNDSLTMSVCDSPTNLPTMINAVGGVEMNRSHDESHSQEGDAPFFSAVSSAPVAEPPMMITLTSATVASVNSGRSQSEAVPPPVATNGSDSAYGSTESAGAHETHATPLSHKAARPLHVSSTANPNLPEETQKAVQDAVAKLVGESEAETAVDGRLSRRRSSSSKGKASKRSTSKTRSPTLSKAASPVVPQQPGQQSPAGNVKAVGKAVGSEVGKNGKLQGAWRKFGSWRRNGSLPPVDAGAGPSV